MRTKEIVVEGIFFVIPVELFADWPDGPLDKFQPCCGAGHGLGERLVPESVFGVRITPACYIHDHCWALAEPSWADFHAANSIFLHNMLAIIQTRSSHKLARAIRNYRALTYYNAVDIAGQDIFWALKNGQ